MTWRNAGVLLAVSLAVVLAVFILPDMATAGGQLALFGFLAAPFKLVGKGIKAVAKVVSKAPKFIARTAPVIASTFLGLPQLGGPGGAPAPDLASPGIVANTQNFPVSDRFSLAATFEQILLNFKGEAEKLVSGVTVKPKLSGPLPILLGVAGTVGVLGILAGAIALARS